MGPKAGSENAIVDALFMNTLVYLHSRKRYYCKTFSRITHKKASRLQKKYRDSDLSRLDVMKVARPVFACKEQSVLY